MPSVASLGIYMHDLQAQLAPDDNGVGFRDVPHTSTAS